MAALVTNEVTAPRLHSPSPRELARNATRPGRKVQVALDTRDTPAALKALQQTAGFIDVIEVGTILCLSDGMHAVGPLERPIPTT